MQQPQSSLLMGGFVTTNNSVANRQTEAAPQQNKMAQSMRVP
jgi:hypothetical protein